MSRIARQFLFSLLVIGLLAACGGPTAVPGATPTPLPPDPNRPSLVGMWVGEYNGTEAIFNFEANGNISIASYGNLQGGTYTVNYDVTPFQLDFVFETPISTINTIFEIKDGYLRIANVIPGEPRPEAFTDFIVLKPYVFIPPETPTPAP
jgi:outer membrane biogenesis lipoprotein LolB